MKISKTLLPAAALVALFASCQDENLGYTEREVANAVYDRTFESAFGSADPDQDWTMAASVTANVSTTCTEEATVLIYTDKPAYANSKLLGAFSVKNGKTANFNTPKGLDQVFAMVVENGHYDVFGYFNVIEGKVNISDTPDSNARQSASTRAEVVKNGVKIGAVKEDLITPYSSTEKKYYYNNTYYTLAELRAYANQLAETGERHPGNYQPFKEDCIVPASYNFTNAVLNADKATVTTQVLFAISR